MNSKRRVLTVAVLAILLVAASGYLLVTYPLPSVLVPAGRVVEGNAIQTWVVPFVAPTRGRIVGTAEVSLSRLMATSPGGWSLSVAPGMLSEPPVFLCPAQTSLPPTSERFNYSLEAGSYTLFWAICMMYLPRSITVTQALEFVPG